MAKIIAAFNITVDGNSDHTAGLPDAEIHWHYTKLIGQGSAILYGRITFQLMEYWRSILTSPSEEQSMKDFALAIDKIPKIIFSRTLKAIDWPTAQLSWLGLREMVLELKQRRDKDVLIGSRSLIRQLTDLKLIDEYQICIHPVIAGPGPHLFEGINSRRTLKLLRTKTFGSGAVVLYYEPI